MTQDKFEFIVRQAQQTYVEDTRNNHGEEDFDVDMFIFHLAETARFYQEKSNV